MERVYLSSRIDWLELLNICKETIKRNVSSCLETLSEPQPDLGKGAGGDSIKLVDLAAEKAIVKTFQKHNISFTLISEESGIKNFYNNSQHFYVTIDPIDGTTNLVHGIPFFCSSIAISKKPLLSDVSVGMVIDLFHDLTYFAQKNNGAYCNGKKITSSDCGSLMDTIVGLDINTSEIETFIPKIRNLIKKVHHIRHFGANALELCYVADGKIGAFVDIRGKLRTTDMAAGYLILKESGGILTDIENSPLEAKLDPKTRVNFIASGNIEIHKKILNLVKKL